MSIRTLKRKRHSLRTSGNGDDSSDEDFELPEPKRVKRVAVKKEATHLIPKASTSPPPTKESPKDREIIVISDDEKDLGIDIKLVSWDQPSKNSNAKIQTASDDSSSNTSLDQHPDSLLEATIDEGDENMSGSDLVISAHPGAEVELALPLCLNPLLTSNDAVTKKPQQKDDDMELEPTPNNQVNGATLPVAKTKLKIVVTQPAEAAKTAPVVATIQYPLPSSTPSQIHLKSDQKGLPDKYIESMWFQTMHNLFECKKGDLESPQITNSLGLIRKLLDGVCNGVNCAKNAPVNGSLAFNVQRTLKFIVMQAMRLVASNPPIVLAILHKMAPWLLSYTIGRAYAADSDLWSNETSQRCLHLYEEGSRETAFATIMFAVAQLSLSHKFPTACLTLLHRSSMQQQLAEFVKLTRGKEAKPRIEFTTIIQSDEVLKKLVVSGDMRLFACCSLHHVKTPDAERVLLVNHDKLITIIANLYSQLQILMAYYMAWRNDSGERCCILACAIFWVTHLPQLDAIYNSNDTGTFNSLAALQNADTHPFFDHMRVMLRCVGPSCPDRYFESIVSDAVINTLWEKSPDVSFTHPVASQTTSTNNIHPVFAEYYMAANRSAQVAPSK